MNSKIEKLRRTTQVGSSMYQNESRKYYQALRAIHSNVFTNNKRKMNEKTFTRYTDGNIEGINNLYTLIGVLIKLLENNKNVKGVDYGCGSHYFVDDANSNYGWDTNGFDSDIDAIADAKTRYPQNAHKYHFLNLLMNQLPLADGSQDFVFCNAVIQHFSDEEVLYAFSDICRILKNDGIFLVIFKRNILDWEAFSAKSGIKINILDENEGMIEIEDEKMKTALKNFNDRNKNNIPEKYYSGMRLIHVYRVENIINFAEKKQFRLIDKIELPNKHTTDGILSYQSGKGIPNAALFFKKA
ncbi:class I SAM-dependent methyltransferase [candidate division KSB1 bacterium]|nr:class I SAM-dependent methyltransferase [candidate division KSB1 bacterium]